MRGKLEDHLRSSVRWARKATWVLRGQSTDKRKRRQRQLGKRLERIDSLRIPKGRDELRLFIVARNAALRLPYLFTHYRNQGVDRFFVVDNGSTDATAEILASQPATHVFRTEDSYSRAESGILWVEYLLDHYGKDRWCVVVDEDELFYYPHAENLSLKDFCRYLDIEGATAVNSLLLDMYSEKPVADTVYRSGGSFLETCPYFETGNRQRRSDGLDEGGVRLRVFGTRNILSKHNLIKRVPGLTLRGGTHFVVGAELSSIKGVTLHFKYFHDFPESVRAEVIRGEYWMDALQYRAYASGMSENPDVTLHCSESIRWRDSQQLVELGLMQSNECFDKFAADLAPPATSP